MLSDAVRKPTIHHCAHKHMLLSPAVRQLNAVLHSHNPVLKIHFNVILKCILGL